MSILHMLLRNLGAARLTHLPSELPPPPPGYRGVLSHAATSCTGCAACVYACSPAAIAISAGEDGRAYWSYDPGRCTFCARCVAICPTHALAITAEVPPLTDGMAQGCVCDLVPQRPCTGCGQPFTPLPAATRAEVYGEQVPTLIADDLCEACRRRIMSTAIKGGLR
jgi:ferredoxin